MLLNQSYTAFTMVNNLLTFMLIIIFLDEVLPLQSVSQSRLFMRHVIPESSFNGNPGLAFPGVSSKIECGALYMLNVPSDDPGLVVNSYWLDAVNRICVIGFTSPGYSPPIDGTFAVWGMRK